MSRPNVETANAGSPEKAQVAAAKLDAPGPAAEAVQELSSSVPSQAYRQTFRPEARGTGVAVPAVELTAAKPEQSAAPEETEARDNSAAGSSPETTPRKPLDARKSLRQNSENGSIVDKTKENSDRSTEVLRPAESTEAKPKISVAMQDRSASALEEPKPDFVVRADGSIEMHRDPESTKSKNVSVELERQEGQLNPTDAQKKSAEELVRYLSARLEKQHPQQSKQGIELDDKDAVIPETAEKALNLVPPADDMKLSPQTRETMAEMNRFRGTGGGVDLPHAATERMASFDTRQVPREAGESQKQAWVKEAWAGLFRPDSDAPYETLRKGSDGGYRYGRYGFSGDQFLSFLDSLGDPPNMALIEALIAKGKLPKDFGNKLKNPEFLKRMKDAAQRMKSGEAVEKSELAELFPKEAQESIANIIVDQTGANSKVGNNPGAISAALMSGKAPMDITESDMNTAEAKQLSASGQQIYDVASKRSASDRTGGGAAVGDVPEGERAELISKALQLAGVPVNDANLSAVNTMVKKESSWDPNAVNNWDWNAQQGHPSEGLMQTIPSTFKAYALPGYDKNIRDPLSNLIAGIRYAVDRYGSLQNVPGIVAMAQGGAYKGY